MSTEMIVGPHLLESHNSQPMKDKGNSFAQTEQVSGIYYVIFLNKKTYSLKIELPIMRSGFDSIVSKKFNVLHWQIVSYKIFYFD